MSTARSTTRVSRSEVREALRAAARDASALYVDRPRDYKGREIGPETVLRVAEELWHLDVIEAVVRHAPGSRLLEVGIAYGVSGTVLARQFGFQLHGVEHPDNIAVYCRFLARQGVDVRPCDLHFDAIPYADDSFDVVVASEITEHLLIPPAAWYPKLVRVLRPGGRLIVTTPNFARIRNILLLMAGRNPSEEFPAEHGWIGRLANDVRVHPREYTAREIEDALIASGLRPVAITTTTVSTSHSTLWARLIRTLMRVTPRHREGIVAVAEKPRKETSITARR